MAPPAITIALAEQKDAQRLAAISTLSFAASDAAYPLIWGTAPEGTHDKVSEFGLFTPVQQDGRITIKAVDANKKMVGLATWNMPKQVPPLKEQEGLPSLPNVNMELWNEKVYGSKKFSERDVDPTKDMTLSLCFVDPDYQRQGIGSLLLQWGAKKADELKARIWLTSTPKAVSTYEKNGWRIVQKYEIMLEKYGGQGSYSRAWMVREPVMSESSK